MSRFFLATCAVLGTVTVCAAVAGERSSSVMRHWAYTAPARPSSPDDPSRWSRGAIDRFTLSRMHQAGFTPAGEADRETLIRRVSFALTGLPPTLEEIDAFLRDETPDAYDRLVDRLLASPRYGERMAVEWLDLARYADTHGYHTDSHRDMWRWRDWVIGAFNQNLPFDQFTVWQLAGDLLPDATLDQRIATGFNRNHMVMFEDGTIAEEYRTQYVADRVATTATVWLGQTLDCARCHDHKYDPFTQRDYYRLFAFFNNIAEEGIDGHKGNARPLLAAPTRLEREAIEAASERVAVLRQAMSDRAENASDDLQSWERQVRAGADSRPKLPDDMAVYLPFDERPEMRNDVEPGREVTLHGEPHYFPGKFNEALLFDGKTYLEVADGPIPAQTPFSLGAWLFPTTGDTMTIASRVRASESGGRSGWILTLENRLPVFTVVQSDDVVLRVAARRPVESHRWQNLVVTFDGFDGSKVGADAGSLDEESHAGSVRHGVERHGVELYFQGERLEVDVSGAVRGEAGAFAAPLRIGRTESGEGFRGLMDDVRLYDRVLTATEVAALAGTNPIESILAIPSPRRSDAQREQIRLYFLEHHDDAYRELGRRLNDERRRLEQLERGVATTMVMRERDEPRETFLLEAGDYRRPMQRVEPDVPAGLPPLDDDAPRNRLGLARWLVDGRNPLTARVIVNHLWRIHFGLGLVSTPEDFGTRGQPPSHPELLDWLAVELVESGWDVKHIQRLIVTSATYCQTSRVSAEARQRDPDNRWLARGPAGRLAAEMVRDQALAAAGLLDTRLGGRPVFPYQPEGLWEAVSFDPSEYTAQVYSPSHGADLYRRSLYTFWKRSAPPPAMVAFDAGDRTVCIARRDRTNTPIQALVLMNDPTYVEAARMIALRVLDRDAERADERIERIFRLVTSRRPTAVEVATLRKLYEAQIVEFQRSSAAADALLAVGDTPRDERIESAAWAAWTVVALSLLNLSETVTCP